MCHDSFICGVTHSWVPRLIHMWQYSSICAMTHPYVTWLIHMWHMGHTCKVPLYVTRLIRVCHDSFICAIAHSYVTHGTSLSFVSDMTHSCVPWLIHMCHRSLIRDTWDIRARSHCTWHDSFVSDMTHSCVPWLCHMCHDSFIRDTWDIRARCHWRCSAAIRNMLSAGFLAEAIAHTSEGRRNLPGQT